MNLPLDPQRMGSLQVAAFYCFTPLQEEIINLMLSQLSDIALDKELLGSVLVASEGVNGTICGPADSVNAFINDLHDLIQVPSFDVKYSWTNSQAFRRFKIRKKAEIVTIGRIDIDPTSMVGEYIDPAEWNSLIQDEETLVVDTRNEYEVSIGSFQGAMNPNTKCFRDFPEWVDQQLIPFLDEHRPKKIAMFCTGGIRCEKATSLLKEKGVKGVCHLKGGILNYLEKVPQAESLWEGECFVFDQRVALNHQLEQGIHCICHACGFPLSPEDRQQSSYIKGVQCSHCLGKFSEKAKSRFAERQRQFDAMSQQHLEDND